jgi:hypothetical protein
VPSAIHSAFAMIFDIGFSHWRQGVSRVQQYNKVDPTLRVTILAVADVT